MWGPPPGASENTQMPQNMWGVSQPLPRSRTDKYQQQWHNQVQSSRLIKNQNDVNLNRRRRSEPHTKASWTTSGLEEPRGRQIVETVTVFAASEAVDLWAGISSTFLLTEKEQSTVTVESTVTVDRLDSSKRIVGCFAHPLPCLLPARIPFSFTNLFARSINFCCFQQS